jgi:hypothetical protein
MKFPTALTNATHSKRFNTPCPVGVEKTPDALAKAKEGGTMRRLLLATSVLALVAMSAGAKADSVSNLGINPTSGAGAFANTNPGTGGGGSGLFADIYQFELVGTQVLTIAFATNTYASGAPQFITNFTGSVVNDGPDNAPGGGDDFVVIGPVAATACIGVDNCQIFGGSKTLPGDQYYLLITGDAGVDAGYGGNLSTFAAPETPLPAAVWLFGSAVGGGALLLRRRRKQQAVPA